MDPTNADACFCSLAENAETPRCLCYADARSIACPADCPAADAPQLLIDAFTAAGRGEWERADELALCVLKRDADNERAASIRQQVALAADYFVAQSRSGSQPYEVQPGDSLSSIAKTCLGDRDLFIALALSNELQTPGALKPGDRLLLPLDRPCAPPIDYASRAAEYEAQGDLEAAWRALSRAGASADPALRQRVASALARELVDRGLDKFASDCPGARADWTRARRIDPQQEEVALLLEELSCDG